MPVFFPALVGAVVGSGITFFFNMWKFHRDEHSSRSDELCKAITDAALLALEYWAKSYENSAEQIVAEAKLRAAQDFFEGLFEDFYLVISPEQEQAINVELSEFVDLLTGGTFSEPGRGQDLSRATMSPPAASRLTLMVRRANRETMPFYRIVKAFRANRRRRLDMPRHPCNKDW
ncbi:hypothetical protein [Shinella sp.]|uniref:hypothetical protein n=1 Tax=Shinella sp. TaxID=1870904 RepID=UPI0028AECD90|nr:hypothetical protein [Shinella sp.]